MTNRTVVVLGGGTGGLVAARRLRRSLDATDRVVLVDRSATYRFAPSLLWVLTGARRPEQISTDRRRLRRSGIEVLEAEVLEIDPAHRKVKTFEAELLYDSLVIALGAELAPDALPGFADAAHNIYTLEGAGAAGAALNRFEGGRLAVVASRLPYKCPARPLRGSVPRRSASATPRRPRPHHHRHLHTRALPDADRRPGAGRCPRRHACRAGHHAAP